MNQLGAMWTFFKKQYLGVEENDGSVVNINNDHVDYDEVFEGLGDDEMKIMIRSDDESSFDQQVTITSDNENVTEITDQAVVKSGNVKWTLCRTTKQAVEIYKQKREQIISTNNTSGESTVVETSEKKTCKRRQSGATVVEKVEQHSTISVTVGNGVYEVESCRDIPYFTGSDDPKHKLNIFRTRVKRSQDAKLPVLFFCHGGSWRRGDRNHRWFDAYSRMAMRICEEYACVVVVIGYRLAPTAKCVPDQCEDVLTAFKFCTDNIEMYGGDSNNIAIFGHSAGAHLISLCFLRFSMNLKNLKEPYTEEAKDFEQRDQLDKQIIERIKGVICVGAVFDVQKVADRIFLTRKFIVEPAFGVADKYDDVSPLYYVEKERLFLTRHVKDLKSVPSFYIANASSDLQLEEQSESFSKKLKQIYEEFSKDHPLWESEKAPEVKYKRYEEGNHFTIIGLSHAMGNIYEPLVSDIMNFLKQVMQVQSSLFVAKEISKPSTILQATAESTIISTSAEEDSAIKTSESETTEDKEDDANMTRAESLELIRGTMGL